MKKTALFFATIAILLSHNLFGALYDPKLHWKTVTTPHFHVHYYEGEESVVQKIVPMVEEVYGELTKRWDCYPWGRTEVVVTDNYDQANGLTDIIPYNTIVLRVVPPTADSSLADVDDWMRGLFAHEFTHVLHLTDTRYPAKLAKFLFGNIVAPNGLTPGWVIEGLPTYFETHDGHGGRGHASYTEMLLRTDILNHQFLKLDQMAGSQYNWPAWQAQYLYGVGFWEYLSSKYGESSVTKFSHKYGSSFLFFMLNHQSKKAFKDEHGKGQTFYDLWKEWKESLEARYEATKNQVEAEGLQEGSSYLSPAKGESFSQPIFSKTHLAYVATSVHHPMQLRLRDLSDGKEKILLEKKEIQQMSFSPDGQTLFYSAYGVHKRYQNIADIFELDLKTLQSKRVTTGLRARDPDVSFEDGGKRLVAVIQKTGEAELSVYNRDQKEWKTVLKDSQLNFPRWVGENEVVVMIHGNEFSEQNPSRTQSRNRWGLFLVNVATGEKKRLSDDGLVESRPVVDRENRVVYFSSDAGDSGDTGGIFNIYAYDVTTGLKKKVTNVLSGAFAPALSPDGKVVFQYYTGRGYELRATEEGKAAVSSATRVAGVTPPARLDSPPELINLDRSAAYSRSDTAALPSEISSKKYSPWKKLLVPRSVLPNFLLIDSAFFVSGTILNNDPLYRHLWYADINYRSDNKFLGYGVGYTYNRWRTPFSISFADYSVDYGNIYGAGFDYFEERKRAAAGISYPWGSQKISLSYFFEDRKTQSGLPSGATAPTLGHYAGFLAQYSYRKISSTSAAISQEKGSRFQANVEVTHHALGASEDMEQYVTWGDARTYIEMPYERHHVIALRAAGGAAFGDQLYQGNFGLGGSLGESPFTATTTRIFTLRGLPLTTFSRDRVWVSSLEYRFPLVSIERGLGTLPLAINQAHFAVFADLGDAMRRSSTQFRPLLGVGAELRADFILSWHLPVTGRLGYGVILTNRDRIAGVKDSLTGADARNGVVVMELGTSF